MSNLCIYTIFDNKTGKPRCTGVKDGDNIKICDIYRPGAGKVIKKIDSIKKTIREILIKANANKRNIVISDFKSHIKAFDIPRDHREWNVYDVHLSDVKSSDIAEIDHEIVRKVLIKLGDVRVQEYQKILAQAAVVYQDLEDTGLLINHNPVWPKWSQKTFSGRSKSVEFNIQGLSEDFHVVPQGGMESDVMINFDWICADIRIASLLSNDPKLQQAFDDSDPYITLMNELNQNNVSDEDIDREECKKYLLKSINSMNLSSVALSSFYKRLGQWIQRCKETANDGRSLKTILNRSFKLSRAKNELAVLNGAMQGSVAHAMQLVLRRIWDRLPSRLITDIHDCLVVSAAPDEVRAVIDIIAPIMLHPFQGILDSNPAFPLQVSIGKRWKKWKLYRIYREKGFINVKETQRKNPSENPSEISCEGQEKSREEAE
jgi:hypothetical protein